MDERVTLRSHLDQVASRLPNGPAVADVVEAIAVASIELADLIAHGPLFGITGRPGGVNSDGDQQKDIDLAADEMMRRALRTAHAVTMSYPASSNPERRNALPVSWFTGPRPRWCWRSTMASIPSFSTGTIENSC
jgi:fructose-1,6-bisphosphatase I